MSTDTPFNLAALADYVENESHRLGLSDAEIHRQGGPSAPILKSIKEGTWASGKPGPTLRKLDTAFRQPPGTAMDIFTGRRAISSTAAAAGLDPSSLSAEELADLFERLNAEAASRLRRQAS